MTSNQTPLDQSSFEQLGPIAKAVFTQDILDAIGLKHISDEERKDIFNTMIATVQDRVLARVLDDLSGDERSQLTELLNHSTPDEVSAFIADHVQDLDGLMFREALQYKAEMIQNAMHIQKTLGIHPDESDDALGNTSSNLPAVIENELPVPYTAPALPATVEPNQQSA